MSRYELVSEVVVKVAGALGTLLIAAASVVACDSHADTVCQLVADCERGGDSEWTQRCQDEETTLSREAEADGCKSQFDRYYKCADDHFSCTGAASSFMACDSRRAELDACLAATQAATSCAKLAATISACAVDVAAGGAGADASSAPESCSAARDCEARCFLDQVANACAPAVADLDALRGCVESCPP